MYIYFSHIKIAFIGFLLLGLMACGGGGGQVTKPSATTNKSLTTLSPTQQTAFNAALAALEADQLEKAASQLKKLTAARQDVAALWLNLALTEYRQKSLASANDNIRRALALTNNSAAIHNLAGLIYMETGAFKQAETHFLKAITLKPQYHQALYNIGLLQDVYLQDVKKAIQYYEQYLALQKGDTRTQDWLSHLKGSL